jgi:hypothetical protein
MEIDLAAQGLDAEQVLARVSQNRGIRRLVVRNAFTDIPPDDDFQDVWPPVSGVFPGERILHGAAILRGLIEDRLLLELRQLVFDRGEIELDSDLATAVASSALLSRLELLVMPCLSWPEAVPEMSAPELDELGIQGAPSAGVLRAFLRSAKLRSVDASRAGIAGPAIARIIADVNTFPALTRVVLARSKLVDSSALALASSGRAFESLDISGNDFTSDGVLALANSPSVATIGLLDIRGNATPIPDGVRQRLRKRLGDRVLL